VIPDEAATTIPGAEEGPLERDELKRRASGGVFIVGTRGLAMLLLGFGGNAVVARLLTPHDFGVVAIGMSFVLFTNVVADGGLAAGLIRRAEPPTGDELAALTALQLSVTVGFALLAASLAPLFGEIGWVTAVMVSSMPLATLQFPGRILLERSLSYRPLAALEVSQVLVYHAWAITFVALGFGVWGLASAAVVMRVAAAFVIARISPVGLVRPRFSWGKVRPLVGFGLRFQATGATWLVRDQGLNASVAAIGSLSILGLWSLARRLMEIPFLLFESLFRVSFPTMSQLVAAKEDPAPLIERAVGMAAIGGGIILTGLAGSAPGLVPGIFGEQWRDASSVVPLACLGLGIGGSVSVATQGYLYAVGDAAGVLRVVLLQTAVLFAVTLPLLPWLGVSAIGVGLLVSSVVEAVALGRTTSRWTHVRLVRPLLAPVVAGVAAGVAGWLVADLGGADLVSGLGGGACSVLAFLVILTVVRRSVVDETFRFFLGSVRAAASRSPASGVP
jgi:O-antigen/teichoic acid export membrane protein